MSASDRNDFYEKELASCEKAYKAGNLGAIAEALKICEIINRPLPEWVNQGYMELFKWATGVKGKYKKWLRQYRQDMIDFERADTVAWCREIDAETDRPRAEWVDIEAMASRILEGTFAECRDDAVTKSYKKFKKESERSPGRYYLLTKAFQQKYTDMPYTRERGEMWEEFQKSAKSSNARKPIKKHKP